MPANILIFDPEYITELTARMNKASDLIADALSLIKNVSSRSNLQGREHARLLAAFDELSAKLGRIGGGVNELARILHESVNRFLSLDDTYKAQAENLSEELRTNHGFKGAVSTGGVFITGGGGALMSKGTFSGGGVSSAQQSGAVKTVYLPVTYIPSQPSAAAKGTKTARELTDAAENFIASQTSSTDASGAGKNIFEAGQAILASQAKAHTAEFLALAAGIVELGRTGELSSLTSSPSAMEFLGQFVHDSGV